MKEETTRFEHERCVTCGATSATLYDGGMYCDGPCKARVLSYDSRPALAPDPVLNGPTTLTLIQQPNGTAAWRVIYPAYQLAALGYPVAWDYMRTDRGGEQVKYAQLVINHRASWKIGDEYQALLWRTFLHDEGKAFGYECDDDLYSDAIIERVRRTGDAELNARSDQQLDEERRARIFALSIADGVTCTTEELARVCRRYTSSPVLVVPNAIDLPRFRAAIAEFGRPRGSSDPLTIGWAGGNRPGRDAEQLAAAWRRIADRYPRVRFLVGGFPLKELLESVPSDRVRYIDKLRLAEYPATFAEIDIGCCPLYDEPFNRSKSPIKAMEFAAAGAAVVASPLVYSSIITHGTTGLLARSADDWEWALATLIERPDVRERLAAQLLASVESEHSLAGNAWRWPAAWSAIAGSFVRRTADARPAPAPRTVPAPGHLASVAGGSECAR